MWNQPETIAPSCASDRIDGLMHQWRACKPSIPLDKQGPNATYPCGITKRILGCICENMCGMKACPTCWSRPWRKGEVRQLAPEQDSLARSATYVQEDHRRLMVRPVARRNDYSLEGFRRSGPHINPPEPTHLGQFALGQVQVVFGERREMRRRPERRVGRDRS